MNYLQDAISKLNQSEGDVTSNYQASLERQVELYLQVSIAISLERIADALEALHNNGLTEYKKQAWK
jgi:hypothetical protein